MHPNFLKEYRSNGQKHEKGVFFDILQSFAVKNGQYHDDYETLDEGCFRWESPCQKIMIEVSYPLALPALDERAERLNKPERLSRKGSLQYVKYDHQIDIEATEAARKHYLEKSSALGAEAFNQAKENVEMIVVNTKDADGKMIRVGESVAFSFINDGTEDRKEMEDNMPFNVFEPVYEEQKRQFELARTKEVEKAVDNSQSLAM